MSAPSSPGTTHLSSEKAQTKAKGRPPALELPDINVKAVSEDYEHVDRDAIGAASKQPDVRVSPAEHHSEPDFIVSRSASATSSLDPYYFGVRSPSDSPIPPLPSAPAQFSSTTPDQRYVNEPVTPARDPASIDRRGLVGVGELATPRWTRIDRPSEDTFSEVEPADGVYDVEVPEDVENEDPDSPWTIEAIDGESSEKEEPPDSKLLSRPLRSRRSMAEESGGEEILYPRQPIAALPKPAKPAVLVEEPETHDTLSESPANIPAGGPISPPSAFTPRRARKRTSDEFEMDQAGLLVSKVTGTKDKLQDDKATVRKHRSLGSSSSTPREKGRDRHRDSINNMSGSRSSASKAPERHARQASVGSSGSNHAEPHHPRRGHTTDYSHLPPSPSTSSIQQFLKHPTSTSSRTPPLGGTAHSSPSVAHSLLRGTQEGWSGLDDEATAEALRKLDGLTGKSARARASVGSFGRPSSLSRPTTPPSISEAAKISRRGSAKASSDKEQLSDHAHRGSIGIGILLSDQGEIGENGAAFGSSDDQRVSSGLDKTPKKTGTSSARSSFTPKRGSTSSTTYASTPSSRDSATMSVTTNATSVSATSGRHSTGKARRNSAGSDVSSIHSGDATSLKDRVASLAVNGDAQDEGFVPPVPPLPKDFSTFKTPPAASTGFSFTTPSSGDDKDKKRSSHDSSDKIHGASLEVPQITSPPTQHVNHVSSGYSSVGSGNESLSPAAPKTPSKKWSFSGLNLKLPGSSPAGSKSNFPLSPRSATFGQHLRKSTSKDQPLSLNANVPPTKPWTPTQPDAMSSAASLTSMSSIGSVRSPPTPGTVPSKTPEGHPVPSRPGTDSSASTNHTTSALAAPPQGALSPTSSVRRGQSQKRLTPSSIPFFRRSSSQSMQMPPPSLPPVSPTFSSGDLPSAQTRNKGYDSSHNPASTSTPSSKKSSVLSLGLPSLLKGSSSRRSLHEVAAKELQKANKELEKERHKQEKLEREKQKKEDKDRSESRISVLMGRKRGKTLSATDPRKPKSPINLPPMQISALEPATAQRVARLKSSNSSLSTPPSSTATRTPSSSSRLMSQTASSLAKQSDSSLRGRNQLPTIAGSPSVGTVATNSSQTLREGREGPPPTSSNTNSGLAKETPTKIPRISSRTSTTSSPPLKGSASTLVNRRASVNVTAGSSLNPSPTGFSTNEFGVMDNGESQTPKNMAGPTRHGSIRGSPSTASTSRVPRQVSAPSGSGSTGVTPRKSNRDSISFSGLRKSSTGSVASTTSAAAAGEQVSSHRFSALSPSRGLNKLLSPKISLPSSRSSNSSSAQRNVASPSSSSQSLSTPSPVPSSIDEEELLGDEEMLHYIRRQQAKKLASGSTQEELDELLCFPEPIPPATAMSPSAVLKSNQHQYLSDYERKEILDYPSVYCIGAKSKKKPATPENSTNNYGYDDERGDYLVVSHDHLAYRYEVIDTLGKGSFGQVLHCRDHCTGESVAIKIIRNKKRFHHQALIEIKILDNLRKWDSEEKHHVIKMTEHFYFRNHLCIAMELLSINLYELIKANGFVGFTTALIRRFTSQMLLSLSLMRHHRIVHCDLKPENVLLKHPMKSAIKVIDFGSSCFEHEKIYTYIQSRFYRSPEVIMGMNYHMAIDMWSLGCILAELYTGFPIFPGENEQEQLACIMEVLGAPDKDFINRSSRKKLFFDTNGAPRPFVNQKGRRRRPGTKTLAQVLRCNEEDFVDFIAKCLVWDPERRIKPQAAMRHPFVTAGKRSKPPLPSSSSKSIGLSGRSKTLLETPKKSQIGAPTPLTARSSRTSATVGPTTPSNSNHASATLGSSSRSYRTIQSQVISSSSSYLSSRTLSGFASTTSK
ncbi:serine/threonine protein kinase, CMGC, dual-specificity [Pleurotus ostreatus]|nr:serine/threonine protein kinase, CMGC, dual-specificity [Pleurotus ostreatus]